MSLLNVENLKVYHGKNEIVHDTSFCVNKGELVAILGANGSGKTTLIKGICSLLPMKGKSCIDNQDIYAMSDSKRAEYLCYIPQRSSIDVDIAILDAVLMGISHKIPFLSNPTLKQKQLATEILASMGLEKEIHNSFLKISEGQRQLVILARAIMQDAPIMIFDEPDSALDFNNKHMVMNSIKNIIKEDKAGIICLHDANFALKYCDRALLIKDGNMVDDINLKKASINQIEASLQKIYQDIKLFNCDGAITMVKTTNIS